MIFKVLPFVILLGIAVRFLARALAVRAQVKQAQAKRAGRLDEYHAGREAFWSGIDRVCLVLIGVAGLWYVGAIVHWLMSS